MNPDLTKAFDALASHAEVSAPLCEAAGRGALDVALDLRGICTRIGLPQARAADVERALSIGQKLGLFTKESSLSWRAANAGFAARLAPLLLGAQMYRNRVHRDADIVEVVLTRPPAPSQVARKLEEMLQSTSSFRDTRQVLPKIAEAAVRQFTIMTPYFDEVGAAVVLNLFQRTNAKERVLVLRSTKDGLPPPGFHVVRSELEQLAVQVVDFRLDRPDAPGNETFHAKVVLADDTVAYVGSSNMNQWSFEYSLELGVYVRGMAAARIAALLSAVRAVSGPMVTPAPSGPNS